MNRWLLIRRLRGPAFLLLFGVTALLNQWGVLSFGQSWPLYLILWGTLTLVERAAFRETGYPPPAAGSYPPPSAPPTSHPVSSTGIVPAENLGYPRSGELTEREEER